MLVVVVGAQACAGAVAAADRFWWHRYREAIVPRGSKRGKHIGHRLYRPEPNNASRHNRLCSLSVQSVDSAAAAAVVLVVVVVAVRGCASDQSLYGVAM